ncbi:pyridoxamine 5'-phosphate oxidase family protein [Paenibacillus sp. NPDC055715]
MSRSGNETSSHIIENGRLTIMFCAFEGEPSVLRLYGKGTVVLPGTKRWDELYPLFNPLPGARQIIVVEVHMVQDPCGFAVLFITYTSERDKLKEVAIQLGEEAIKKYSYEKGLES